MPGHVARLVAANSGVVQEETPAHLAGSVLQSRPRVWKRLRHVGHSFVSIPDRKRRRNDQDDGGYVPAQIRTGVG